MVWKVLWSSKLPFWFLKKISKLTLICQASSTPTLPQNILPETPPAQYRESPHRTNGYWNISIPLIVHKKVSQSTAFGLYSVGFPLNFSVIFHFLVKFVVTCHVTLIKYFVLNIFWRNYRYLNVWKQRFLIRRCFLSLPFYSLMWGLPVTVLWPKNIYPINNLKCSCITLLQRLIAPICTIF